MTSVAAVIIARDEERCIERAIRSVYAWVDEVVVLDTGSADRTPQIAARAGARVETWVWRNNFAAARNAALDLSSADVNLILDADEELLPPERLTVRGDAVGLVTVHSVAVVDGCPITYRTDSERLLPRAVRYEGVVHEQPQHALETYMSGADMSHDGYMPKQMRRKEGRNEGLLRRAMTSGTPDPYMEYQLGKELQAHGRYRDSGWYFVRALGRVDDDAPWRHSLVVRTLSVLGKNGDFSAAFSVVRCELARYKESPDFHFALGNLLMDFGLAHPDAAHDVLALVESCWVRCLEIGDRPDLPGSVPGRGSYLAVNNLRALYVSSGRKAESDRLRDLAVRQGIHAKVRGSVGSGS